MSGTIIRRHGDGYICKGERRTLQAEKVYVQHLVAREGAAVHAALADGSGSVFVCGDGADMAKAVHAALADVFTTHGGLTASEASARLTTLANEQRYVRDVWS